MLFCVERPANDTVKMTLYKCLACGNIGTDSWSIYICPNSTMGVKGKGIVYTTKHTQHNFLYDHDLEDVSHNF